MNAKRWLMASLSATATALLLFSPAGASTNDRIYQLGDHTAPPNPSEGASNGAAVGSGNGFGTLDGQGLNGMDQLPPLVPKGTTLPVYRTITGRPDGVGGLGIEFVGTQQQYVHGQSLNSPGASLSATGGNFPGSINYNTIFGRGIDFWVRPGSAAGPQSIVLDSNQHGARINGSGNFSMRYAGNDYDTTVAANSGTWRHIMVVSTGGGSVMYIDGIAEKAVSGSYFTDTSNLVIGANTAGDDGFGESPVGFTGGTAEFFTGVVDDLDMFVFGDNSDDAGPPAGQDWGDFNFATDNSYAAFTLSGIAGDIDNNGSFQAADRTAFINGWRNEQLVDDIRVGDLSTFGKGDLNFDGITDIRDLVVFQALLPVAGLSAITAAELNAVPEPSTAVLALLTLSWIVSNRRRGRARRM